ncbi:MAG: DNA translocase FtsK 4TM domain-containing protein, partial [Candidatus Paceibacterota bacterium]
MASKKKEKNIKKNTQQKINFWSTVKSETKQAIIAITFLVLSIIFILSSLNKAGIVGDKVYYLLSILLGIGYFLIPIFFLLLSISFFKAEEREFNKIKVFGGILFFISGLGLIDLISKTYWTAKGGYLGWIFSTPLLKLFGLYASIIILIAILTISCLILFETKITIRSLLFWRKDKTQEEEEDEDDIENIKIKNGEKEESVKDKRRKIQEEEKEERRREEEEEKSRKQTRGAFIKNDVEEELKVTTPRAIGNTKYVPPPLSLLEKDKGRIVAGDVKANANIIKRTLQNFDIDVEMDEVSIGPSVTRYALKPAEGVKISRILGLQNDLSLALAAHPIRIEAPIPGKSLVGIEIPNSVKSTVGLSALIG